MPLYNKLAKIVFGAHVASGATLWPRRLKSLLGMGVATFRLVAALLTILGVWINLDTFFYLRNKSPQMDVNQQRAQMINYKRQQNVDGHKYSGYVTLQPDQEPTGKCSLVFLRTYLKRTMRLYVCVCVRRVSLPLVVQRTH